MRICKVCKKELNIRQEKYCSIPCANKGRKEDGIWRNYVIVPRNLSRGDLQNAK